jgi:hypothetical protein
MLSDPLRLRPQGMSHWLPIARHAAAPQDHARRQF